MSTPENRIRRIAKACEPCRIRKSKCDIVERTPCSECGRRGMGDACVQRQQARRSRRAPDEGSNKRTRTAVVSSPCRSPRTTTSPRPLPMSLPLYTPKRQSAINRVDTLLLKLLRANCPDLEVDFALPSERLIDLDVRSLTLADAGLQGEEALARALHYVNLHFTAIHHNTPFLHRPTVESLCRQFFSQQPLALDERSLLFSVLALGTFRECTWVDGRYQPVNPAAPATLASALLFNLSQQDLDRLDSPTELAVQSLFLLHTYVCNTSLGRWSRDFVARAVMMSHEVGLNRRIPPGLGKHTPDQAMRRAILYLYVLFADVYSSALDSHPPLIKTSDYDLDVFHPILYPSSSGSATPPTSSTAGLSAFVDLVRTGGQVLQDRAGDVLELEQKLDQLRDRLGPKTFSIRFDEKGEIAIQGRAILAGRLLRQIHYNWLRIAIREPQLETSLAHSSLAVCARAAVSVLSHYRHVFSAGLLNLPWMQLRRVVTSVELVLIAYLKGELLAKEAEDALSNAMRLFEVLGTRWQSSNRLGGTLRETAKALGLRIDSESQPEMTTAQASLGSLLSILPADDAFLNDLWGGPPIDMMDGFGSWMTELQDPAQTT